MVSTVVGRSNYSIYSGYQNRNLSFNEQNLTSEQKQELENLKNCTKKSCGQDDKPHPFVYHKPNTNIDSNKIENNPPKVKIIGVAMHTEKTSQNGPKHFKIGENQYFKPFEQQPLINENLLYTKDKIADSNSIEEIKILEKAAEKEI